MKQFDFKDWQRWLIVLILTGSVLAVILLFSDCAAPVAKYEIGCNCKAKCPRCGQRCYQWERRIEDYFCCCCGYPTVKGE